MVPVETVEVEAQEHVVPVETVEVEAQNIQLTRELEEEKRQLVWELEDERSKHLETKAMLAVLAGRSADLERRIAELERARLEGAEEAAKKQAEVAALAAAVKAAKQNSSPSAVSRPDLCRATSVAGMSVAPPPPTSPQCAPVLGAGVAEEDELP